MTMESLIADARLGVRRLLRAPVFGVITVLTLGLGIGASTAIFSVANAVLLRPLPYAEPDRLVAIWSNNTHQNEARNPVSPANFDAFRREATSFAGMEAMYSFFTNAQLELGAGREMLTAATVTPGMFDLIGRPTERGRGLREGDDSGVVHEPRAVDTPVQLRSRHRRQDRPADGLSGPADRGRRRGHGFPVSVQGDARSERIHTRDPLPDVWLMLPPRSGRMVDAAGQPVRTVHFLAVIGRLKPGVPIETARAELAAIATRRAADFPDSNDGWLVTALPLHAQVTGQIRPVVLLLFGGVALLLIMMCLNIANVLLARASGRQRDVAVRAALGASLGRLVQQSLVESVSAWRARRRSPASSWCFVATPLIVSLAPADLPRLSETRFDATRPVVRAGVVGS